jgi:hypothetical protein
MRLPLAKPARWISLVVTMMLCAACGGSGPPAEDPAASVSGSVLPTGGELQGWSQATDPESYDAETLWEYINGQADFFIDYGFVRVDAAEYRHDREAISVVLEVYEMGRPQEAFGIFAAERASGDRPLEVGSGAYLGANVLGFWQGEKYVKLTSFDSSPAIEELLIGLAEEVSSRMPVHGEVLETLRLFPEEGRVEASERFIPTNFLSQSYLTDGYRVDFTLDGEDVQLFIVDSGSPDEAQSDFNRLEAFYSERGEGQVVQDTTADLPMLVVDGTSKIAVFRIEDRLGGALARESMAAAREGATRLAVAMGAK